MFATELLSIYPSNQLFLRQLADANLSKMGIQSYMKILFISALLPYPPHQGGQVRMYNLLKTLSASHEITLLSFIRNEEEKKYLTKLNFCKSVRVILRGQAWQMRYVLKAFFGNKPFLYKTYDNDLMRNLISQELSIGSYDLIHLEPSYVWPSLPNTSVPTVVAEHNIESTIYDGFTKGFQIPILRPLLYWDVAKLRFWERNIWRCATHVVTVSEQDAGVVRTVVDTSSVSVVSNGVDLKQFLFRPKNIGKKRIALFVGYFGWLQNRDALSYLLDSLWSDIHREYSDLSLRVVGKKLPQSLQNALRDVNGTYISEVDDITEEYYGADILIAPIRIGGGTRYKILEAMATGLPVVTTSTGASGLGLSDKKQLLVADDISSTMVAIKKIFSNDSFRRSMLSQARTLIENNYSWDMIAHKLDTVWTYVKTKH